MHGRRSAGHRLVLLWDDGVEMPLSDAYFLCGVGARGARCAAQ